MGCIKCTYGDKQVGCAWCDRYLQQKIDRFDSLSKLTSSEDISQSSKTNTIVEELNNLSESLRKFADIFDDLKTN